MSITQFVLDNLLFVVLAAGSGGMLLWQLFAGSGANPISPQAATLLINREDALVLDVRSASEWNSGHIAQARHVPPEQLDSQLMELEKYKQRTIIVGCHSGMRSTGACKRLRKLGFEKVYNLSGGMSAWREAGLPITTRG